MVPKGLQFCLKVMSCFGNKVEADIIERLKSSISAHFDFVDCLDQVVKEGCILKVGSAFQFVHDKVREAAYSLIPESEKRQVSIYP